MALLPFKLNAFELEDRFNLGKIKEFIDKAEAAKNDPANFKYKLEREETLSSDKACAHCPKHLLLTEQINKVMDKMASDPSSNLGNEVPIKINRLKFLFYTQALIDKNGKRDCHRYMDYTPDLEPTKFDGQFDLIAEEALRFKDVSDIQYINPHLDELVYYYRGEGADKDVVVQAILTKEGGKFRYFRYTPSQKEANRYNLPDLGNSQSAELSKRTESQGIGQAQIGDGKNSLTIKADVEKNNKYIPKNVHFLEAKVDQEIVGGLVVKASSDTSLKGNVTNLSLKKGDGNDLVLVDLDTNYNGKIDHKITVPYSIQMTDASPVHLKGKFEHQRDNQVMTMSITDQSVEWIRTEYRRNTASETGSYVIARDVQMNKNEVLSLQYAKGEDNAKYASVKHVKSINKNITLVLDVRVDQDRRASLFYQVSAKF